MVESDGSQSSRLIYNSPERVFNERDAARPTAAVVTFEPTNVVQGQSGIVDVARQLVTHFASRLRF